MNELELNCLQKTTVVSDVELVGYGSSGSGDCNDCHYISSDCTAPLFCDD